MLLTLLGFLVVVSVAHAVPGPDFAIVLRHAVRGRRAGHLAAAGILSGLCVHVTAAALGLSALLARSATGFMVVKIAGAGYLVFLGIQALWSSRKNHAPAAETEPASDSRRAFAQGLLSNLSNPKAVLFFVSLLPQFIDHTGPVLPQTLLLGAVTVVTGIVWWTLVVILAGKIRVVLGRPRVRRAMESILGVAFVGLGVRLLRVSSASAAA